jgi:hypothetical protein
LIRIPRGGRRREGVDEVQTADQPAKEERTQKGWQKSGGGVTRTEVISVTFHGLQNWK